MCLQLGVVLARFGRKEEAVTVLKQGLQHSSSLLSLQLNRALVEVYHQTGNYEKAVEVGESALVSAGSQFEVLELLQLVYFLIYSHYNLNNESRGREIATHWTINVAAESLQSLFALQCLEAEKKHREGSKEEAVGLYEAALQTFGVQSTYLAVHSRFVLGWLNADLNRHQKALESYLQAAFLYSAHFPHTLNYANCLNNLAAVYESMKIVARLNRNS